MTPTEKDKELLNWLVEHTAFTEETGEAVWRELEVETFMYHLRELITAYTNKQVEAVLDRLESMAAYDPSGLSPVINPRQIEAERNKLKEEV